MRILVDNGADPFLLSNLNANVLHAAAESRIGHGLEGALEIWKRFPNRLNINQTNKWGETPLHVASWCSAPCVKLLLEAGANPDVTQEDGQVALHCSGLSGRGPDRREIVSLLCGTESRNHINTQDVDGRPPIFDFLDDSECLEMLIDHGARSDLVDKSGKSFFHHACIQDESDALRTALRLVDDFLTATKKDDDGNTPLIESLCHKNIDCALVLLELEDVGDIVGKDGWAAVHYAVEIGDVDLLQAVLKHPSFVRGMKTVNGKTVDAVAMEAGTWCGEVKELVRKYNSLG
jgi:ankyrin repeat protein